MAKTIRLSTVALQEGTGSRTRAAQFHFCRPLLAGLATLAISQLAISQFAVAQVTSPQFPGVICEEVRVPMRDGTLLTTDVYLPSSPGRYPVVMQRDPYGRLLGNGCFAGLSAGVAPFAQQG